MLTIGGMANDERTAPGAWPVSGLGPRRVSGPGWCGPSVVTSPERTGRRRGMPGDPSGDRRAEGSTCRRQQTPRWWSSASSRRLRSFAAEQWSLDGRHCGGGAALVRGLGADGRTPLPVPLAVGAATPVARSQVVFEMVREFVAPRYVTRKDGLRVTTRLWSVTLAMRRAEDLGAAVRIFDMAAYNDLVSDRRGRGLHRDVLGHQDGRQQVREAMGHADENAWSPTETDFRLVWGAARRSPEAALQRACVRASTDAGSARRTCSTRVRSRGDYDGAVHLKGAERSRDVEREAAFAAWDSSPHDAGVSARPHAPHRPSPRGVQRAGRKPASDRRWTITAPAWWTPTDTVGPSSVAQPRPALPSVETSAHRGLIRKSDEMVPVAGYYWTLARRHAEISTRNVPVRPQRPHPGHRKWERSRDQGRKRWATQ